MLKEWMEKLVSNKLSFETGMFWAILCIWGFALLSFVRYDGEEFIQVIVAESDEKALAKVEAFRNSIASISFYPLRQSSIRNPR